MKIKEFDIIDVILERFDYVPMSKERHLAYDKENKSCDMLCSTLNPKQHKLFLDYEAKKNEYLIMYEKDVATYVLNCLRSILK